MEKTFKTPTHKYNKESLIVINNRYCGSHTIHDSDIDMANAYVNIIEQSRTQEKPRVGDIIEYTSKFGDYYGNAHMENVDTENQTVYICERPYVPFVGKSNDENGIFCSTSGGVWHTVPISELTYIGKRKKTFCAWGSCGPCADGAVEFQAEVNVWQYIEKDNYFISKETGKPYTTKDFCRMHIYYVADEYGEPKDGSQYIYFGDGIAWRTDLELQAWLETFKAEVFAFNGNDMWAWFWKEEQHSVSPEEFDAIDLPEDALINNGLQPCKRLYDEENHVVHTYWVWYWDDPSKDWREAAMEQNRIRDERNALRSHMKVNQVAKNAIRTGKVKPIDLSFMKGKIR